MPSPPIPPVPQEPERLYLLVCDQAEPQVGPDIYGLQAGAGQWSSNVPLPRKGPTFRRATPDDLHAFGFEAIAPGVPEGAEDNDLVRCVFDALELMTASKRAVALDCIRERYIDGRRFVQPPTHCPKCSNELEYRRVRSDLFCAACGFSAALLAERTADGP